MTIQNSSTLPGIDFPVLLRVVNLVDNQTNGQNFGVRELVYSLGYAPAFCWTASCLTPELLHLSTESWTDKYTICTVELYADHRDPFPTRNDSCRSDTRNTRWE